MIADLMDGKEVEQPIQSTTAKELKINKQLAAEFCIDIPKTLAEGDK